MSRDNAEVCVFTNILKHLLGAKRQGYRGKTDLLPARRLPRVREREEGPPSSNIETEKVPLEHKGRSNLLGLPPSRRGDISFGTCGTLEVWAIPGWVVEGGRAGGILGRGKKGDEAERYKIASETLVLGWRRVPGGKDSTRAEGPSMWRRRDVHGRNGEGGLRTAVSYGRLT